MFILKKDLKFIVDNFNSMNLRISGLENKVEELESTIQEMSGFGECEQLTLQFSDDVLSKITTKSMQKMFPSLCDWTAQRYAVALRSLIRASEDHAHPTSRDYKTWHFDCSNQICKKTFDSYNHALKTIFAKLEQDGIYRDITRSNNGED